MIKLNKHERSRNEAILNAQKKVGPYTNYLHDVLKPAIESGNWDEFESLDIGFTVTGESLGKIGDNHAWRNLQKFFEPDSSKTLTLEFFIDGKVIERNLRNQLKALALKMMWLSPRTHSFQIIYTIIHGLKKWIKPLLNKEYNSFEYLDFDLIQTSLLDYSIDIDFERASTYLAFNKLYSEREGLPFKVALSKNLSASDFSLSVKEAKQHNVIPQRLYYRGLKKSEELINELYPLRDELTKLSNYITTYFDTVYQGYAKYILSEQSKTSIKGIKVWMISKQNVESKARAIAFQDAILSLHSPTEAKIIELLNKHKPELRKRELNMFHPCSELKIGTRTVTGIREAQILFKELNGGCIWGLMSRTGMRADEVFNLHTVRGHTTEIITGQAIHSIHADLSKTVKGSQSKQDEFITTEIGKKAYEILQTLHEPLRKCALDGRRFFYKVIDDCSAFKTKELTRHSKAWFKRVMGENNALTAEDLMDLKISDPNLLFNIGDDYQFSGHQLRRSFAYYLTGYELCGFPQLKQQLSHISMAMTRHYSKNASKFQKYRKLKQNLVYIIEEERIDQKAKVYLNIYKKLSNNERVAGGKGKDFAKNMTKAQHNLFKDKVDNDMLSLNYWKNQIRDQKRHIHAVAPGIYCTSTGCSLRTQVNLLECVDCKNDFIVDAVFAEAKRKDAEINMLWDIEHDQLTPQTASEAYVIITAAERIMNDLEFSYTPVVMPKEVQALLIPLGVTI